jgi:import inner membrane translocase subunit TIM16
MSAKVIAQMVVSAVQVLTRAGVQAYQQALRNAKQGPGAQANPLHAKKRMPLDEALGILNLEKANASPEVLDAAFQKFFALNDPGKGGSFYLQSKIFRANEAARIELGYDEEENGEKDGDNDDDDGDDDDDKMDEKAGKKDEEKDKGA